MKKIFLVLLLCFCACFMGRPARSAGFEGPGAGSVVTRAADVYAAWDDAPCELTGHILEKIPGRKNRYIFEDASGKVVVEIKHHVFGDFTVTPAHLVRLVGEVEIDSKYPNEVEVDYLAIIGPASQFKSSVEAPGG